jgi:hypothetical protein
MKQNVGTIDKVIRLLIAAIIVVLYFFTDMIPGTLGIVLLIFAGVFTLTSLVGFCPIWTIFKFTTTQKK